MRRLCLLTTMLAFLLPEAFAAQIQKEVLAVRGTQHSYYYFVPSSPAAKPMPIILMFHGSGDTGRNLIARWRKLAEKERVVLVSPNASDPAAWSLTRDGAAFVLALVETMNARCPLDLRRLYLFGESNGGPFVLNLALQQSQYFTAVAAHATALPAESDAEHALRKIPMGFWKSDSATLSTETPSGTEAALRQSGFALELHDVAGGRDHLPDHAVASVWEFLKAHRTPAPQAQGR